MPNDYDEDSAFEQELDALLVDEKAFNKRFRRIEGEELEHHRELITQVRGKKKERVTIYFDSDVIEKFKSIGASKGVGYQTLINDALRRLVDIDDKKIEKQSLKEDLLKDKKFLRKLKTALAA